MFKTITTLSSMKTRQLISIVLFILAAALLLWWFSAGHHPWTTTEQLVTKTDPLFGTSTQVWVKQFTPGLEVIGPVSAVAILVGLWLLRRPKSKTAQ